MTDQAGQPVQGAFVFVMRMPGFVFVKGDTPMADSAYRFTVPTGVPPGTYTWLLTLTEAGTPGRSWPPAQAM